MRQKRKERQIHIFTKIKCEKAPQDGRRRREMGGGGGGGGGRNSTDIPEQHRDSNTLRARERRKEE